MILNVSVAVSRIIEECNMQTSLDLQAMRARGVESANAIYDDWVLTEDNKIEVYYALQDVCSDMAFVLRTLLKNYSAGKDIVSIDIEDAHVEPNESTILEAYMRKYLKHSILSWWYRNRDAELTRANAEAAAAAINQLFTQCLPRTGIHVGRYF